MGTWVPSVESMAGVIVREEDVIGAAKYGDQCFIRAYLDETRDSDVDLRDGESQGTLLHWACSYGRVDVVRLLLDRGADINATDHKGWTGLHRACNSFDVDTVRLLLARGANLDSRDTHDWTPLHVACHSGRPETVNVLLEAASDETVKARTGTNLTALHIACEKGFAITCRLLIQAGLDPSLKDREDYTPLHLASAAGSVNVVRLLLECGASIDASTEMNHRPLHLASQYGHSAIAKLLLEAGADTDVRDEEDQMPLHLACTYGHTETARLLLEYGTDVNAVDDEAWSALHWACQVGNAATARVLMDQGADYHARTAGGHHALHLASEKGHEGTVRVLLEAGSDPNAGDGAQYSPLHWAAQHGHAEVAILLLGRGAAINSGATTPLHLACSHGHVDMVHLLLEDGADPSARDVDGKLAEEIVGTAETTQLRPADRSSLFRLVRQRRLFGSLDTASPLSDRTLHDDVEDFVNAERRRSSTRASPTALSPRRYVRAASEGFDVSRDEFSSTSTTGSASASISTNGSTSANLSASASDTDVAEGSESSEVDSIDDGIHAVRGGLEESWCSPIAEGADNREWPAAPTDSNALEVAKLRMELDRVSKCVACLSRDRDTLLFPCKHLVLCLSCYSRVAAQGQSEEGEQSEAVNPEVHSDESRSARSAVGMGRCPTCRADICGYLSGVVLS